MQSQKGPAFFAVNCGAIPGNLLEAELFGYAPGAFTDASKAGRQGIFEIADRGTVFLDEIGDMPLPLQVKILHVIENKSLVPVGGREAIHVDVRIITATNKNLKEMIRKTCSAQICTGGSALFTRPFRLFGSEKRILFPWLIFT